MKRQDDNARHVDGTLLHQGRICSQTQMVCLTSHLRFLLPWFCYKKVVSLASKQKLSCLPKFYFNLRMQKSTNLTHQPVDHAHSTNRFLTPCDMCLCASDTRKMTILKLITWKWPFLFCRVGTITWKGVRPSGNSKMSYTEKNRRVWHIFRDRSWTVAAIKRWIHMWATWHLLVQPLDAQIAKWQSQRFQIAIN